MHHTLIKHLIVYYRSQHVLTEICREANIFYNIYLPLMMNLNKKMQVLNCLIHQNRYQTHEPLLLWSD